MLALFFRKTSIMDEKHCEDHHHHNQHYHHNQQQQQPQSATASRTTPSTLINSQLNLQPHHQQQAYKLGDKYVCIKQKNICVLLNNLDKISTLFDAKLVHVGGFRNVQNGKKFVTFQAIPGSAESDPIVVAYNIQVNNIEMGIF